VSTQEQLPLEGVCVLDLARFIAGPFCSMLLGDMGADVVKVERPGGEDVRHLAPFKDGESVYAMLYNRNKRAITISTRSERGVELLAKLIEWADVVVENYRPGTLERMGLSYERMCEINPRVILTSISGFGQTGPLRERALFDAIGQAMAGVMSLTGDPEGPPMMTGTYTADHTTGLYATIGTLLALRTRDLTGEGQLVDVALLDSMFAAVGVAVPTYLNLGRVMTRTANRDSLTAPGNAFPTSDGWVYIDAGTDGVFRRLVEAMGRPELAEDPRYSDGSSRYEHLYELEAQIREWTERQSTAELSESLEQAGVPFGPVADIAAVAANPQLVARDMIVELDHPSVGPIRLPGLPIKLSRTPGAIRRPPPVVGQHTAEVLQELCGVDQVELEQLQRDNVV
jgi:crotonobetainyl-CoA:carnitine CoA-transferase CaiB-like acyl-CoA transferase